jgi:hypothetical protein
MIDIKIVLKQWLKHIFEAIIFGKPARFILSHYAVEV